MKKTKTAIPPCLLDREQAAAYLSISTRTVSDWQRRRIIPTVKLAKKCIRFRRSDLDAMISRRTLDAIGGGC